MNKSRGNKDSEAQGLGLRTSCYDPTGRVPCSVFQASDFAKASTGQDAGQAARFILWGMGFIKNCFIGLIGFI
jgi:hypothetical protein